jgi:hypothetical protein
LTGLIRSLALPTLKLLAVLVVANAFFPIIAAALSGSSPMTIVTTALFIESGLMITLGGLIMVRTPKIESIGSKILLGGAILFIVDLVLAFTLTAASLG